MDLTVYLVGVSIVLLILLITVLFLKKKKIIYISMILRQITVGPIREHTYLLINAAVAVVIDPGGGVELVLKELEKHQAELKYILLTHGHPDHILATGVLKKATGAKIGMHKDDLAQLNRDWSEWTDSLSGLKVEISQPDFFVGDGETIVLNCHSRSPIRVEDKLRGNDKTCDDCIELKVIHTPGHSEGSVCYYEENRGWLFSGDTLFAQGSVGRTDLPGSDPQKLAGSLEKVFRLPKETKVFPGHGLGSSIKEEIRYHIL